MSEEIDYKLALQKLGVDIHNIESKADLEAAIEKYQDFGDRVLQSEKNRSKNSEGEVEELKSKLFETKQELNKEKAYSKLPKVDPHAKELIEMFLGAKKIQVDENGMFRYTLGAKTNHSHNNKDVYSIQSLISAVNESLAPAPKSEEPINRNITFKNDKGEDIEYHTPNWARQ